MRACSLVAIICLSWLSVSSQELSQETRKQFVADQEEYLKSLRLSLSQQRAYQTITIKYEKVFMNVYRSGLSPAAKKKQVKNSLKKKAKEMSKLLSKDQYRLYLRRQKEIAENYNE